MEVQQSFFKAGIPVYMEWLKNNRNGLSYEFMPHKDSPLNIKDSEE